MEVSTAIETRRSVRHYDPEHQMTEKEINQLMSLAIHSPTVFNLQNWRFVLVRNPELRKKIRTVVMDQSQITDASLLVVLCADLKAWEKQPARHWRNAPKEVQDFILPAIEQYYQGQEQLQRDEAMRACGIAAQTLMLAAKSMGYDSSCPMGGFDVDTVGKIIHLPENHIIALLIAIGKAIDEKWPQGESLSLEDVVITDHF